MPKVKPSVPAFRTIQDCPICEKNGVVRDTVKTNFGDQEHRISFHTCRLCHAKIWPEGKATIVSDLVVKNSVMVIGPDDSIQEFILTWKL